MRIYLAGPMRGMPELNFPAFNEAAAKLREDGHYVFNPAQEDCKYRDSRGFDLREAFCSDLHFICLQADAIALLPGWRDSLGATAEHAVAVALALKVIEL